MSEVKYFPFAPGVRFKISKANTFIKKFDRVSYENIFSKDVVTICHGGFLENIYNLFIIDAYKQNNESLKINHICNPIFNDIYYLQGISNKSIWDIPEYMLFDYTSPVFFNKDMTVSFINVLHDYIYIKNIKGQVIKKLSIDSFRNVWKNSFVSWDKRYTPSLRFNYNENLEKFLKLNKFSLNKEYVLLFPDKTNYSINDVSLLDWNYYQIKEFSQMLMSSGIRLIILTQNQRKYHGINCLMPEFSTLNILTLMKDARAVISKDPDYSISSMLLFNNKVLGNRVYGNFDLQNISKFHGSKTRLYLDKKLNTLNAYRYIIDY